MIKQKVHLISLSWIIYIVSYRAVALQSSHVHNSFMYSYIWLLQLRICKEFVRIPFWNKTSFNVAIHKNKTIIIAAQLQYFQLCSYVRICVISHSFYAPRSGIRKCASSYCSHYSSFPKVNRKNYKSLCHVATYKLHNEF